MWKKEKKRMRTFGKLSRERERETERGDKNRRNSKGTEDLLNHEQTYK